MRFKNIRAKTKENRNQIRSSLKGHSNFFGYLDHQHIFIIFIYLFELLWGQGTSASIRDEYKST